MTKNSKLTLSILFLLVLVGLILYFTLTSTKSPPPIDAKTEEEKELATLQRLAEESNFTPTTEQEQLDIMSELGNN